MDAPRAQRPTVLIVDDSAEVAEVTSSLFERLGYDTDYRDSADAALKYLAEGSKIDLVFSDIVMPGTIDGVGLAREIRSRYPNLPVVLTTGYSDAAQAAPGGPEDPAQAVRHRRAARLYRRHDGRGFGVLKIATAPAAACCARRKPSRSWLSAYGR